MGIFGGSEAPEMWDEQKKELDKLWGNANGIYRQYSGNPGYTGPFYSGLTGDQQAGMDMVRNFANGQAGKIGGTLANTAMGAAGWGANYGGNADSLYQQYSMDPTQQIVQNAGQFVNNDLLQGQIDAANRDTARALTEGYLPGSERNAAMGGNLNSSRRFMDEAIATRGAQDRMADVSAQMRGDAYNNGINMASSNYFNGANAALASNAQVGNALTAGFGAAEGALGYNNQVAQGLMGIGGQQQMDANAQIAANKEAATYAENLQWNRLAQKAGIVNGSPTVMQSSGSGLDPLQAALGVGLLGAGIYTGNPALFGAGLNSTVGGAGSYAAGASGMSPSNQLIRSSYGLLGGGV